MNKLTICGNDVYLDEKKIECIKNFNIVSSTKVENVAELTLNIDVSISQVET